MRIIYLFLALLVASCAAPKSKPAPATPHHTDTPPTACEILVSAVNRGDWAVLKSWAKPGTSAVTAVQTWENAAQAGNPVKVGKFLNARTVGGTSQKPLRLYSFSLENKDGTVNPHWLQIKVREQDGEAEVVDFWIFGW